VKSKDELEKLLEGATEGRVTRRERAGQGQSEDKGSSLHLQNDFGGPDSLIKGTKAPVIEF
jgi:hypothetical protein